MDVEPKRGPRRNRKSRSRAATWQETGGRASFRQIYGSGTGDFSLKGTRQTAKEDQQLKLETAGQALSKGKHGKALKTAAGVRVSFGRLSSVVLFTGLEEDSRV